MDTVLITGATGFIGHNLCLKMLEAGWRVKGFIRKSASVDSLPVGVEPVYWDSIESCSFREEDFKEVHCVVHLAGCAHMAKGPESMSLEDLRKINVSGTVCLARMAAQAGVKRFIFISSVKVNGEESPYPFTENNPPAPRDAYGLSKMEAEQALWRLAAETGLQAVILRSPLVYGPGVKANFRNLIKIAGSGVPLPLKGIDNRRSFIYVGNLADAIMTCVNHPLAAGETLMVSDGQDISTPDLIRMIAFAMGKKPALFYLHPGILKALGKVTGRGAELHKLTGSLFVGTSKIRVLLGWKPPFTLEEGIKETINSHTHD